MKDFCTGREIDIQGLMRMARYSEEDDNFNMFKFIDDCGTSGCHVGTYCIRERKLITKYHGEDIAFYPITSDGKIVEFSDFAIKEFNISRRENQFLFMNHNNTTKKFSSKDAQILTKEEAIRRLRKFIYWKMRKAELLEDLQTARTREGNWCFAQKVLETV